MELLVVGGTRFVGRFIVAAAMERGVSVTLFHRGNHPDVFPELPTIVGDRDVPGELAQLGERRWDAVIDTCGYRPEQVRSLLDVLEGDPHYTFISSVSVYGDVLDGPPNEDAQLASPLYDEELTGATYAGLKVGCEQVAIDGATNVLIIRPGLVAGPWDPTDRFTYWCVRASAGGPVLAPEAPDLEVQWIDARDLGDFVAASSAAGRTGRFNVVTPPGRDTLGGLLAAADSTGRAAPADDPLEVVWADEDFLAEHDVAPWSDLPLWLTSEQRPLMRTSNDRAAAAGLSCRPTAQTVQDTLAWFRTERGDETLKAGLDRERELALIERWKAQRK